MSEIKLLQCPFCGGEAYLAHRINLSQINCTKCLAMTNVYKGTAAIKAWNTRKPMDKIVERLKSEEKRWHESGKRCCDEKELGVAGGFRYATEIVKAGEEDE